MMVLSRSSFEQLSLTFDRYCKYGLWRKIFVQMFPQMFVHLFTSLTNLVRNINVIALIQPTLRFLKRIKFSFD